jgi:glycosyltransferase involved in cell wall biosynthesis
MRIVIWHGYLLGGTGSNVYTRALAREWSRAGHDVTIVCQDRHPERHDLGGARVVVPELPDRLLPVFVLDEYEGLEARLLQDFTPAQREAYVAANADAVRALLPADVVFTNHVLLGGPVGRACGARWRVKAHGSELEYSMRGNAELSAWGAEALRDADAVYVGSEHIRRVLEDVVGHVDRVQEVPPGVDVDEFVPRDRDEALRALIEESRRDPQDGDERHPDPGNAERFAEFFSTDAPTVLYFGKLIENKGVHLLLEALRDVEARAVIVGFGDFRAELESMADPARILFTGPLEHRHLTRLLPLADACVVPSIFPEAFGMVAAEAAAAGCPPLVARHSGLAEVADGLEAECPPELRDLASFRTGDVADLAATLARILGLGHAERAALVEAGRRAAVRNWSWAGVADRILAQA